MEGIGKFPVSDGNTFFNQIIVAGVRQCADDIQFAVTAAPVGGATDTGISDDGFAVANDFFIRRMTII